MGLFSFKETEKDILNERAGLLRSFYPEEDGRIVLRPKASEELFSLALELGDTPRLKPEVFELLDRVLLETEHRETPTLAVEPPPDSGYSKERFNEIIKSNLRLRLLTLLFEFERNRRRSARLLLAGSLLLLLSYFFGQAFESDLLFDVINILGSLLIWTAGEKYFLEQAENRTLRRRYGRLLED